MRQEALRYFTDTQMILFAMLLFIACFAGIVLWVFRKNANQIYAHMERLPLEEEK